MGDVETYWTAEERPEPPGAEPESAAAVTVQPAEDHPPRRGMFQDPLVRAMAWASALLVLLYLAALAGALLLGVLGNSAPRTAAEQKLMVNRAEVERGSKDPTVWVAYIEGLVADGQYGRAQTMIDTALKARLEDPNKQYFGLAQASLELARGRDAEAVRAADAAMSALTKQRDKAVAKFKQDMQPSAMSTGDLGSNFYDLVLVKARALEKQNSKREAVAALDIYLHRNPGAADILEWRGDLKLALKDREGAVSDFKAAAQYLPDDAGLKKKLSASGASK